MRYWVYINDKVVGPYEEEKLGEIEGFSPDTLICTETVDPGKTQEWVKASLVFDFNDPATAVITSGQLTPQDAQGNPFQTQFGAANDEQLRQQLLEKIDRLTQEIEGMKGKLDEAIAASNAAQEAASQQLTAFAAQQPIAAAAAAASVPEEDTQLSNTAVNENDPITNTVNLVNHAEEVVLQAQQSTDQKPVDFLDEIQIGENKDNLTEKSNGEEVVLRSALDSLYNVHEAPEEEKESTFQDLLSPIKLDDQQTPAAEQPAEQTPAQESAPEPTEEIAETQSEEQPKELSAQQTQQPEMTDEKREEIINEITGPAAQADLIAQALEEIEKEKASETAPAEENNSQPAEEQPASEELSTTEESAQQQPAEEAVATDVPNLEETPAETEEATVSVTKTDEQEPLLDLSQSEQKEEQIPMEEMPADKSPLDLEDQPQLTVHQTINDEIPQVQESPEAQQAQEVVSADNAALTPMNPEAEAQQQQQENEEAKQTAQELIPGKELAESDELISQQDLDEAFATRAALDAQNADMPEVTPVQQTMSDVSEYYNPKEMTEVQLQQGSTYLISDFIPPAETGNKQDKPTEDLLGSPLLAEQPEEPKQEEMVEEIVPQRNVKHDDEQTKTAEDLTMSKVVLENTIKTKRGATMDIKTVPMVKEPGDSERLDLSDSDLDLSAQHDLKSADLTPSGSRLTKGIFSILIAIVLLVLLYGMLAYLEFIPAKYNVLKSSEEPVAEAEIMNESNGQPAAQPVSFIPEVQPQVQQDPMTSVLNEVKNYMLVNGQTLEQLIKSRYPAVQDSIEWNITQAVDPDNYSILIKVPPENAQSFKISYRFNYNMITKALDPTISDSKNLLDSVQGL